MTYADKCFIESAEAILNSPFSDKGMPVRPHWHDGTPAHTRKIFCDRHDYVLDPKDPNYEFPMMTLRRTYWKTALQEILWIYRQKSNVIADLQSKIWDDWNVGDGTIGKAYGYQIAQAAKHHRIKDEDLSMYPSAYAKDGWVYLDQMDAVFYDLRNSPMSRSIMTSTYNMSDLADMGLRPCAYGMYYNVTQEEKTGRLLLNAVLMQRSQDMLTASNWNTVQYAFLLMLVAREVGMEPGRLVHIRYDCHIYDRHEDIVRDMIAKAKSNPNQFAAPIVYIPDAAPDFYHFTPNDMIVENYQYDEFNEDIEVAV